jgi:molybdopterin-guanine dinucleotide biosynthesis protein MobB
MTPPLPVVRVAGPGRNVGKTWLARHLIEELTRRGYAVGAIKRSHHPLPLDKPGADTDLFARAGALAVSFGTGDGVLVRDPQPATSLPALLGPFLGHADIVVVEGFKDDTFGAVAVIEQPAGDGIPGRVVLRRMDGSPFFASPMDNISLMVDACEAEFRLCALGDPILRSYVRRCSVAHGDRCLGITLGVRVALAGLGALDIHAPIGPRRLSVTVETASCAADAVAFVTGCSLGKRNLRLEETGKLAAVFTDLGTRRSIRVAVRSDIRPDASVGATGASCCQQASDVAYRTIADADLLDIDGIEHE